MLQRESERTTRQVALFLRSPHSLHPAQEHFEGAVSADKFGQPVHGAATGGHPHAELPLREDGLFAAGETHVAGQPDLAAVARRPATDEIDRGDWSAGQSHEKVRPRR
jgi:hypothetical protein